MRATGNLFLYEFVLTRLKRNEERKSNTLPLEEPYRKRPLSLHRRLGVRKMASLLLDNCRRSQGSYKSHPPDVCHKIKPELHSLQKNDPFQGN